MESNQEFSTLVEKIISYVGRNKKVSEIEITGNPIFRRVATKTAIMSVVLAMKTVIRFRTVWTNWATRPIPSVCVMSLSQEQIFEGKTPEDLLSFFREPRFENPIGEILIETRSLRFPQKTPKSFTVSIPVHFFLKSLTNNQRIEHWNSFAEPPKSGLLLQM